MFGLLSQAVRSDDSEDGGETETGEDGEEGEKDKEEREKEDEEKTKPQMEDDTKKHGFLILSREDSTMVKNKPINAKTNFNPTNNQNLSYIMCLFCNEAKLNLFVVQILQTGQEIMELDTSGFATQGPTVFAGNIGDNKYIIQVSPMGIRLLEGGKIG